MLAATSTTHKAQLNLNNNLSCIIKLILPGAGLAAYVLTFKLPGHNVAPAWRRTCLQLSFSIIKKTGKVHIKHHRMNLRRQRPRNGRRQAPWARSPVTVVHNSEAVIMAARRRRRRGGGS